MNNTEFRVTGMTCEHCVASVTEELSELETVSGVAVQLHSGGESLVAVQSNGALNLADVRSAIEAAGYVLVTGQ